MNLAPHFGQILHVMAWQVVAGLSPTLSQFVAPRHAVPTRSRQSKDPRKVLKTFEKSCGLPRFSTWKEGFDSPTGCHPCGSLTVLNR